ncbi:MAG: DUF4876 domain-containing protein [Capnocytophaga sp.]|nr:DUF4876 domain-containing protein [Capnocytophaga sp.]
MKRIFTLLVVATALWSCKKDDDNFVQNVAHVVTVTYGTDYADAPVVGAVVLLVNQETSAQYSFTTNAEGKVTALVPAGTYNIQASKSLTASEMETLSGQSVEASFNGSVANKAITLTNNVPTTIATVSGRVGDLIIKQVYYQASDTRTAANYRDQFFEIYNNSNETIYLDGLCFAQVTGVNSVSSSNAGKIEYLANGQYNWAVAQGITQGEKANTDYIYSREILMFPGTGTQYPIEAGKSVIVAQNAINHKNPLTVVNANGSTTTYQVTAPELTVDLSKAHFEANYRPYVTNPVATDVENPSVTDMILVYHDGGNRDMILDSNGRDAFAIFRATKAEIDAWLSAPLPTVAQDDLATAGRHKQIPISIVIDGVNLQHFEDAKAIPHRLPDRIDAGEIKGVGRYSSKSAIRKVLRTLPSGRKVYQDTNNSTNDFNPNENPDVSAIQ